MRLPRVFLVGIFITLYLLLLTLGSAKGVSCTVGGDPSTDCSNQINQNQSQLTQIQQQQATLQSQLDAAKRNLNSTTAQLAAMQQQVASIQAQLAQTDTDLNKAQAVLDKNRAIFRSRVRDDYINGDVSGWELVFGNSYSFADTAEEGGLRLALMNRTHTAIVQYTEAVKNLSNTRAQIATAEQTATSQLAQIQAIRNQQASQVTSIQRNQSALNSQIAQINAAIKDLTSQQQAIIAAKLAATSQNTTVGTDAPQPPGLPGAPGSGYFTFLTYGYPHRIGMNQYGAYGRASAGQNYTQILNAYYGMSPTQSIDDTSYMIRVASVNRVSSSNCSVASINSISTISMRTYLHGIGEMPSSWNSFNAFAAQSVAARTYALYTKNSGKYASYGFDIGSDTCDQYYTGGDKGGTWDSSVDQTNGLVLGGSNPIGAFYSSTDGGYTCTDFSHNNPCTPYLVDAPGGNWGTTTNPLSYDGPAYGNSPWFHKAWGDRQGGSRCNGSGGYNPWLSPTETADIFNAVILSQASSSYNKYLSPPDGCNSSTVGWSPQQVINQLTQLGLPHFDSISAISVTLDGRGNTHTIAASGSNGYANGYDGNAFEAMFNLRSIGTLSIYTSLYDTLKSQ